MKSKFLNQLILPEPDEGFSFVEVLAGILIATVFVLITTQAIVISTIFRINAQRASEAKTWIEEEVESDQYQATTLSTNNTLCDTDDGNSGYADALRDSLNGDGANITTGILTRTIVNKDYKMLITFEPSNAPFDVLEITYQVWFDDMDDPNNTVDQIDENNRDEEPIADFYTEMIPTAALDCALNG